MGILYRNRLMAFAEEDPAYTEYGSAFTESDVLVCYDPIIQPTIDMVERPDVRSFDSFTDAVGGQMGTATFRTDLILVGDGSPPWALKLLPACGMDAGGVSGWERVNETPDASGAVTKTITIANFVGGVRKRIKGCMGNAVFNFVSGQPASIDWNFLGCWLPPDDTALPATAFTTQSNPTRFADAIVRFQLPDLTTYQFCVNTVTINLGNNVEMRPCHSENSGYLGGVISTSVTTITIDPESRLVADQPFHDWWLNATPVNVLIQLSDGGSMMNVSGQVQITNNQEGERQGLMNENLELKVVNGPLSIDFTV